MPSLYRNGLCSIYTDSRYYCFFDNIITQVMVTECYMTRKSTSNLLAAVKIMIFTEWIFRLHFKHWDNAGK